MLEPISADLGPGLGTLCTGCQAITRPTYRISVCVCVWIYWFRAPSLGGSRHRPPAALSQHLKDAPEVWWVAEHEYYVCKMCGPTTCKYTELHRGGVASSTHFQDFSCSRRLSFPFHPHKSNCKKSDYLAIGNSLEKESSEKSQTEPCDK